MANMTFVENAGGGIAAVRYPLFDHIINIRIYTHEPSDNELEPWTTEQKFDSVYNEDKNSIEKIPTAFYQRRVNDKGAYEYRYFKEGKSLENTDGRYIEIKCPEGGIKPSISVKCSLVGGSYCYAVVVDIINLHIDLDIRKLDEMKIEMGYRGVSMRTLECSIMTAYQLSPGPDSVTRLECIATGAIGILTESHPITIMFNKPSIQLDELVMLAARAMHDASHTNLKEPPYAVTVKLQWSEKKRKELISVPKKKTFSNGAAVMAWLTKELDPYDCIPFISDGSLVCISNEFTQDEQEALQKAKGTNPISGAVAIYKLDRVTSASIVGGLVNVTAPFVPQLRPGDLFQMLPTYFDGSQFLSERYIPMSKVTGNAESIMFNTYATYRIIKMDIEFSTNNGNNKMNILAVPITTESKDLKTTLDEVQKDYAETRKAVVQQSPSTSPQETPASESTSGELWYEGLPKKTGGTDYIVSTSEHGWDAQGLNAIAQVVWSDQGTDLKRANEAYQKDSTKFVQECINSAYVSGWFKSAKQGIPNEDIYCLTKGGLRYIYDSRYMWPLIAAYTYLAMQEDLKKDPDNRIGYRVNLEQPDRITDGDVIVIPPLSSNDDMDNYKDFADMFIRMGKLKISQGWTDTGASLINIGCYLGGKK